MIVSVVDALLGLSEAQISAEIGVLSVPAGWLAFSSTGPNRAVNAASPGALQVSAPQTCLMHLAELHSHSGPTFFFSLFHFLARGGPGMVVECEN